MKLIPRKATKYMSAHILGSCCFFLCSGCKITVSYTNIPKKYKIMQLLFSHFVLFRKHQIFLFWKHYISFCFENTSEIVIKKHSGCCSLSKQMKFIRNQIAKQTSIYLSCITNKHRILFDSWWICLMIDVLSFDRI